MKPLVIPSPATRNRSSHRMSVDVLGYRMHDNISAMIQRVLNIRTQKCVVHDNLDPMPVRNGCHLANVHQSQGGVRGTLNPNELGVIGTNESLDIDFNCRCEGDVDPVRGRHFSEVAVCPAVDI